MGAVGQTANSVTLKYSRDTSLIKKECLLQFMRLILAKNAFKKYHQT